MWGVGGTWPGFESISAPTSCHSCHHCRTELNFWFSRIMSTDTLRSDLQAKWNATCKEVGVSEEITSRWFETLATHYSEDGRYYHTLNHIKEMLGWVERYSSELDNISVVSLAAWFHEYVLFRLFSCVPQ